MKPCVKPPASPWPGCAAAAVVKAMRTAAAAAMRVMQEFMEVPRSDSAQQGEYDCLAALNASLFARLQCEFAQHIERIFATLAQGLRGEPHRGVDRAEAVVVLPLHDLEKEAPVEGVRIGVEELAGLGAVVEDRQLAQLIDALGRQVVHR